MTARMPKFVCAWLWNQLLSGQSVEHVPNQRNSEIGALPDLQRAIPTWTTLWSPPRPLVFIQTVTLRILLRPSQFLSGQS